MSAQKAYIGDGVYAKASEGVLVLTTEDGVGVTNCIILEPDVLANLINYAVHALGVAIPVKVVQS